MMGRSESLLNASREMMETNLDICWNSDSSNLDEDQDWEMDRYKVVILNDRLMSETAETEAESKMNQFNNNSTSLSHNNQNIVVMINHSLNGPSSLSNQLVLDSAADEVEDDDSSDSFSGECLL